MNEFSDQYPEMWETEKRGGRNAMAWVLVAVLSWAAGIVWTIIELGCR